MPIDDGARAVLMDPASPMAQVVKAVSAAEASLSGPEVNIGVSASITADLLGLFLRKEAALAGVRARIIPGGYDDPIGDMERFAREELDRVVLIPFFDNVLPSFEAQIASLAPEALALQENELRQRYRLAFERAGAFESVHVCTFHRLGRSAVADGDDAVGQAVERLNVMLREEVSERNNVHLVDAAAIVAEVGRLAAFDQRFYFRSKAPYSRTFFSELARRLAIATRGFGTYFYKALALDCDNTLWGGVVGEDLVEGIKLDPFDPPGNIFWRVQNAIADLEKAGLLLCLCTKNNPADVEEVFRSHPHMVLKPEQIVARRVNWQDKVANLQELAGELNIGLDSMIFLDDSPVEAESVRARLPMVKVMQVPTELPAYPALVDEIAELYLGGGVSVEAASKTSQYRQRAAAIDASSSFATHEDYLGSLDLTAVLRIDETREVPRISELSKKSNQFNLTTRRYSEAELLDLMSRPDAEVVSISVSNRFGDAGLTGVIVLRFTGAAAVVENFLMSCRVLGQGVEFSVWSAVAERCRVRGCTRIDASFLATNKNAQVRDFYDRLGLALVDDAAEARRYSMPLKAFVPQTSEWVKIIHG